MFLKKEKKKRFTGRTYISHNSLWQPDDLTEPHKPPEEEEEGEEEEDDHPSSNSYNIGAQTPRPAPQFVSVCVRDGETVSCDTTEKTGHTHVCVCAELYDCIVSLCELYVRVCI